MKLGRHFCIAAMASLLCAVAGSFAEARTNRALVVAVNSYPNLPAMYRLKGAGNDARLVRSTLQGLDGTARFKPENIVVLSDAVDGAAAPTLLAIVEAFDALAEQSRPGDFVYVHFAGHGSHQPARAGTETDGKDEVFLPLDIGLPSPETRRYPNGLVDDVIGEKLDAIRARGAFVWVVFDTCQSATLIRSGGAGADEIERWVDPAKVGAFATDTEAYSGDASDTAMLSGDLAGDQKGRGGLVAFYAAQTTEPTPELLRPKGGGPENWHGLFTYTLFSKIVTTPNVSFRQIGQAVMSDYVGQNRSKPTPYFEGELDLPLFLASDAEAPDQWTVEASPDGLRVPAGTLHRVSPGAKFAILVNPDDPTEAAIGYAEARNPRVLSSLLTLVAYGGKPRILTADVPERAFARLVESGAAFSLTVSVSPAEPEGAPAAGIVEESVRAIAATSDLPMNLELVSKDEDAALRLAVMSPDSMVELTGRASSAVSGREPYLWLLPASGSVSTDPDRRPIGIAIPASLTAEFESLLADNLLNVYRATNLSKLASSSEVLDGVQIAASVSRWPSRTANDMLPATVTRLAPRDMVQIDASNSGTQPVDINVLYVDSRYAVTHWLAERLHKGDRLQRRLFQQGDQTFGDEQLLVIATRPGALRGMEDLSFLAQKGIRSEYRGSATSSYFDSALNAMIAAPRTREAPYEINRRQEPKGMVTVLPVLAVRAFAQDP